MAQRPIFDQALLDEGILGTPLEPLARSIYQQESGSGRNSKTSYAGAVGGLQILPATFNSVADNGWSITDPYYNARGGLRYIKQGWEASKGDPNLTAAYYYGGPGGMNKLANGVAVGDPRNPNAPTTAQYAANVVNRAGTYPNPGNNMPPQMNDTDPSLIGQVLTRPQGTGILDRIGNAPGMSEALISMGAGLLSGTGDSNPLSSGLAKGLTGFNKGYEQGLENNKARAVPINQGAFTQVTRPDGTVEIIPNPAAQDFILKQYGIKGQTAKDLLKYKFDNQPLSSAEQRDLREIDEGITDTNNKLTSLQRTRTALNDPKLNDWTRIAASGLPFGKAMSEALGLPEADVNRMVEDLKVDSWLVRSAKLKGAISDAENTRLNAPMPSSFASKEKLLNWMDEREKDLKTMYEGLNRIRDTDYRKGQRPAEPNKPADTTAAPTAPAAPAAPATGNSDDPLNLGIKKR